MKTYCICLFALSFVYAMLHYKLFFGNICILYLNLQFKMKVKHVELVTSKISSHLNDVLIFLEVKQLKIQCKSKPSQTMFSISLECLNLLCSVLF